MNLSAPKNVTFYIAAVLWLLGLLSAFVGAINGMMPDGMMGASFGFWLAIIGGLVLILGNALDGM